jgi:hypothetical protein
MPTVLKDGAAEVPRISGLGTHEPGVEPPRLSQGFRKVLCVLTGSGCWLVQLGP